MTKVSVSSRKRTRIGRGRGKHATSEPESLAETFVSLRDFLAVLSRWICTLFDQHGTVEAVPIGSKEDDDYGGEELDEATFVFWLPFLCRFRRHALSAVIRERCQSTCINLWLEPTFSDFFRLYLYFFLNSSHLPPDATAIACNWMTFRIARRIESIETSSVLRNKQELMSCRWLWWLMHIHK